MAGTANLSVVHGISVKDLSYLGPLTIPGYLREVCSRYGEQEALVMHGPTGTVRWSYHELWQRSLEVAKALVAHGVDKDTRVGILMTNRPEYLAALFGTAMAGGVAVALNTFSTGYELGQLLELSAVSVLLFERQIIKKDFADLLSELEPAIIESSGGTLSSTRFPFLRRLVQLESVTSVENGASSSQHFLPWREFITSGADTNEQIITARCERLSPTDHGGIFFSSGTTSLPKGILHTQRAFALQWWHYPKLTQVGEGVRSWTGNGFFWSANIAMTVGVALSTGGAIVLQPWFDPEATLKLIEQEQVHFMNGRPHQWARLREADNWDKADLSSLRYVTRGDILWEHPKVSTRWVIPMGYGNTETLSMSTSIVFNRSPDPIKHCFGTPLPGNALKIVDPQSGEVVPCGERGEIHIKGPTLMLGYLGKPAEETFDEESYLPTGDGGYIDEEGRLFWEGRLTEIIKTGGANVSPEEIDTAIALFPGVRRAQTVGVPHDTLGEKIVSCVIPNEGVSLNSDAIRSFLKERLASFKIPKEILFFTDDEIAVTGSGKVKVDQLRKIVAEKLAVDH